MPSSSTMKVNLMLKRGLATATASASSIPPKIKVGVLLSRIPIIKSELNELEKNYYEYQSELEKRLMWTFPAYFYFKKGTVAEHKFLSQQKGPISKKNGIWFPKGIPDIKHGRERSTKQEVELPNDNTAAFANDKKEQSKDDVNRPVIPNDRITDADRSNDMKSLERQLSRTLYLLVKDKSGIWKFPNFDLSDDSKPLHVHAENELKLLSGDQIHTWSVSATPVGVLQDERNSTAEFIVKSHILAGKFDLVAQKNDVFEDFAWLTKGEVSEYVPKEYFNKTGFLLADN
ncbi:mitochondrial 54S ribosomal protein mL46 [Saccharomyces paradoxus]|uniref:Large ribosomal subunit protein mL46 n=1 Tax=Saccharomyces paradoxus TaxID=27291 RepID=A0A8B8UYA9_SACPA|nr:Mrpl17 [Saccharomyces paradoxus]QHS75676.1 Mrpl17 [Saccharomyces paradoxus]